LSQFHSTARLRAAITCLLLALTSITATIAATVTVQPGETLYGIASRYKVSVNDLVRTNQLKTNSISPGQVLELPKTGSSAQSTTPSSRVTRASVRTSNSFENLLWPAEGVITTHFTYRGKRRGHSGIDIAAPFKTPISAALSGTVTSSGWDVYGYGNLLVIRGVDGRDYYYAHNSKLLVRRGQRVAQGQLIALMGSTGRSTGSHLHFEVRSGSRIINPYAMLPSSRLQLAAYRR
jgi:murein DD-endopeptidase MepM/ murein hydrolase activator NlpD